MSSAIQGGSLERTATQTPSAKSPLLGMLDEQMHLHKLQDRRKGSALIPAALVQHNQFKAATHAAVLLGLRVPFASLHPVPTVQKTPSKLLPLTHHLLSLCSDTRSQHSRAPDL